MNRVISIEGGGEDKRKIGAEEEERLRRKVLKRVNCEDFSVAYFYLKGKTCCGILPLHHKICYEKAKDLPDVMENFNPPAERGRGRRGGRGRGLVGETIKRRGRDISKNFNPTYSLDRYILKCLSLCFFTPRN